MRRYGDFPVRTNAEGKMLCKWCASVVPKGRMYFCTKECAFEVQIRRDSAFLRVEVKKRDKGICVDCGIDTQKLKRIVTHMRQSYAALTGYDPYWANEYWFNHQMTYWHGSGIWERVLETCRWEADHIVEVTRGGAPYLDNVQTLCVPCHKAKSKRQHKERAMDRRRLPLFAEAV